MKKIFLAILTLVLMFSFMGCGLLTKDSMDQGQDAKEKAATASYASIPVPTVTNFLERQKVADRAKRFDVPDKLCYIYLYVEGVGCIGYYTIKGRYASLNSFLVPQQKLDGYTSNGGYVVLDDMDIDGTYGHNVEGIFFFTTEGTEVEWNGKFLFSDFPLPLSSPKLNVVTVEKK